MATDEDIEELKDLVQKMSKRLDAIEENLKNLTLLESGQAPLEPGQAPLEPGQAQSKITENSYTTEEALDYFSSVLNNFNSKATKRSGNIEYVASAVEADLKFQSYKGDDFLMTGVDVSEVGESGVSSVKISIKAVPKQTK
jgi:hypothetical protein